MIFDNNNRNSFGLNSNAPIWISPNWEALVLLTKEKWKGEASWGRSLVYESSRPRNKWLYWMITTTIDGWSVREYTDTGISFLLILIYD